MSSEQPRARTTCSTASCTLFAQHKTASAAVLQMKESSILSLHTLVWLLLPLLPSLITTTTHRTANYHYYHYYWWSQYTIDLGALLLNILLHASVLLQQVLCMPSLSITEHGWHLLAVHTAAAALFLLFGVAALLGCVA
jgi:hypothetical protein